MYQCLSCGNPVSYVYQQKYWYCNHCGNYATSIHWNPFNSKFSVVKKLKIWSISLLISLLPIIIFFSFLFGLLLSNNLLMEISDIKGEMNDIKTRGLYYDDLKEDRDSLLVELYKSLFLIFFSIILIFSLIGLLYSTVQKNKWWLNLRKLTDYKNYWHFEARRTKHLVGIYFLIVFGLIVIIGILLIIFGMEFLFRVDNDLFYIALFEITSGTSLIHVSYVIYSYNVDTLSQDTFPLIEKPINNSFNTAPTK